MAVYAGFDLLNRLEQVKIGRFEAIYEDNAWIFKPYSNDQNQKSVIEFLFSKSSQNVFCQEKTLQDTFNNRLQDFVAQNGSANVAASKWM